MNWFKKFLIKIALCVYPVKIYGKENIPSSGALFVCNHFSVIDCLYLLGLGVDDLRFLAKKEAFRKKLFAKILKSYGAISIDRNAPEMRSLIEAIKTLKSGGKLMIFPEGTRNKSGTNELQEIKSGAAVFAVKAKCPIVPIMIFKKAKIFSRNKMIVGTPFSLENYYSLTLDEQVNKEMDEIIATKMKEQHNILKEIVYSKRTK